MSKWATLDEYLREHETLIKSVCQMVDTEDSEALSDMAYEIWLKTRGKVNRSPITHCFDCVYIVANCAGKKTSISFLTYVGEVILGRRVRAMDSGDDFKWFMSDWGKEAIVDVIDDESLYFDCMVWWRSDEEE
tara:strand:- start:351 stop:749 length:399 start_codon:yes stop_codon:yes gene_type:complete